MPIETLNGIDKRNRVIWLTGLPESGKSAIGKDLANRLRENGVITTVIDNNRIRYGLCHDLGFSEEEGHKKLRRVRELAKILYDSEVTPIITFITPLETDRRAARETIGEDYIEVYVESNLETNSSYEIPKRPEIIVNTEQISIDDCVQEILDFIF